MSSIDDLLKNNITDKEDSKTQDLESGFALAEQELDIKIHDMRDKKHEDELKMKAGQMNLGYIDLKGIPIPADVITKIPLDINKNNKIICFYYLLNNKARIAISEEVVELLARLKNFLPEGFSKIQVEWFLTSRNSFASAMQQYEKVPQVKEPIRGVEITSEDFEAMSG